MYGVCTPAVYSPLHIYIHRPSLLRTERRFAYVAALCVWSSPNKGNKEFCSPLQSVRCYVRLPLIKPQLGNLSSPGGMTRKRRGYQHMFNIKAAWSRAGLNYKLRYIYTSDVHACTLHSSCQSITILLATCTLHSSSCLERCRLLCNDLRQQQQLNESTGHPRPTLGRPRPRLNSFEGILTLSSCLISALGRAPAGCQAYII